MLEDFAPLALMTILGVLEQEANQVGITIGALHPQNFSMGTTWFLTFLLTCNKFPFVVAMLILSLSAPTRTFHTPDEEHCFRKLVGLLSNKVVGLKPGVVRLLSNNVIDTAYFTLQVIYARRKFHVSPPAVSGNEDFERVYRAHLNSSEYYPLFVSMLWIAGVFFSQALAVCIGVLYLYSRYKYFKGYSESALKRLRPMYFGATMLWILIGLASLGVLNQLCSQYLGYNPITATRSYIEL